MMQKPLNRHHPETSGFGGPWVLIAVALVAVAALGAWGAVRDVRLARRAILAGELSQIRSHAERTVGWIEAHLEEGSADADLTTALRGNWLRDYWRKAVEQRDEREYAAVVGSDGRILVHSDATKEDERLETGWRGSKANTDSIEAWHTRSEALTGGEPAIDIALPVSLRGAVVGRYHVGLSLRWFDEFAERRLQSVIAGWVTVITGIGVVIVAACVALVKLLRRQAALQIRLGEELTQRFAERQQLLVGLAHEIRNPLNAIQINLHVLKRRLGASGDDGTAAMIGESTEEVDRIDALIREVLGLAISSANDRPIEDLAAELEAIREFVGDSFARQGIALSVRAPSERVGVPIGRTAFRQIMLNLLENSRNAMPNGGRIDVEAAFADRRVEVSVSDDGPGVPPEQRRRLFEPFFSTRDDGLGLGLAIVRKHLQEIGGEVVYDPSKSGGARFTATMPASRREA